MALSNLLYLPSDEKAFQQWSFFNQYEHNIIITAIQKKFNKVIPTYILDPVAQFDLEGWLARHQQAHSDFNQIIGYPGQDLQTVNFKDPQQRNVWAWLHFQEHFNVSQVLVLND